MTDDADRRISTYSKGMRQEIGLIQAVLHEPAVLSTVVLVAMWDGGFDLLVEKGVVGVAINVAVVALLVLR